MSGLPRHEDPDPRVFLTFDERVQHEELRYSLRSPSYSALLSALLMGSGQIYNGQGRRGVVFLLAQVSLVIYGWDHFMGRVVADTMVAVIGPLLYGLFIGTVLLGGLVVWVYNIFDAYEVARFVSFIYDRHSQLLDVEEEAEHLHGNVRSAGVRRGRGRQAMFLAAVVLAYTAGIFFLGSRVGGSADGMDGLLERLSTATNPELHLNAAEFFLRLERLEEAQQEYLRALRHARSANQRRAAKLGLARVEGLRTGVLQPEDLESSGPLIAPTVVPVDRTPPTVVDPDGNEPLPTPASTAPPVLEPTLEIPSPPPPSPEPLGIDRSPPVDPGPEGGLPASGEPVLALEYALERADLELSMGSAAGAEEALRPVLGRGLENARLEWTRGEIARTRQQLDEAARHFQRASELDPGSPRPFLGMAEVARQRGDSIEVETQLARAVSVAPDAPEAVRAYSDFLLSAGRAEEAYDVVSRALVARPEDQDLLYRSFVLSRQAGNSERAHQAALALARAEYRDGEVYSFLARRALAGHGSLEDARRHVTTLKMVDPHHPKALLLEGEVLRRQRRPGEVVALLRPHIGGGNLELAMLLAESAKEARNYSPGIEALERALEVHPPSSAALKLLGILRKRTGDFPGALRAYQRALELDAEDKEALYLAGYIHMRLGQWERGIERFEAVRAMHPGYGEADFYLARCYEGAGRMAEAVEAYQRVPPASPNHDEARAALETRTAPPPVTTEPPVDAPEPESSGAAPEAADPAGEGERFPAPPPPDARNVSVDAYADALKEAELAYASGELEEALGKYRAVLDIKQDHFRSHHQVGMILQQLGRREEAVESFQKARSLEPDHLATLTELGQVLVELDREEDAVAVFEEALRIDPRHLATRYKLGVLLERRQSFAGAEEQYQAIIWYHPEYVRAHEYLGNVYYKQRKYERAASSFRTILRTAPDDHTVRFKLALTYLQLDQRAEAREQLEKLSGALPEDHSLRPQVADYLRTLAGEE